MSTACLIHNFPRVEKIFLLRKENCFCSNLLLRLIDEYVINLKFAVEFVEEDTSWNKVVYSFVKMQGVDKIPEQRRLEHRL